MRRVYLCGHTGSENRGCEAILRSTSDLLRECGINEVNAMTRDMEYDRRVGLNGCVKLLPYPEKSFWDRVVSYLRRKLLKDGIWTGRFMYRKMFEQMPSDSVIFNVGGDTYCYGTPYLSYALNQMAQERGIPTVFWGCSVDERVLHDTEKQCDINRYFAIVTRERKTYELLRSVSNHPERVFLACDPAFTLKPALVDLPQGFLPRNTLGINISPFVVRNERDSGDLMLQNVHTLIENTLNQTDMHICLIPHVYDPRRNTEDIRVLRIIYERYRENRRVSLIEDDLSCAQLKYIVSQCRFFVGARTHPTIAAYSSGVPALAISYSIKSLGIARDILGDERRFAVPWQKIQTEDHLWKQFSEEIMAHEQEIIEQYSRILPEYTATAKNVLQEIFKQI